MKIDLDSLKTATEIYNHGLAGDEEVVGVVEPRKPMHDNDFNPFGSRFLCPTCKGNKSNPGSHCHMKGSEFIDVCSSKKCQCKCRTRWLCKSGNFHPYGTTCECSTRTEDTRKPVSPELEKRWENLLEEARLLQEKQSQKSQIKYKDEEEKK